MAFPHVVVEDETLFFISGHIHRLSPNIENLACGIREARCIIPFFAVGTGCRLVYRKNRSEWGVETADRADIPSTPSTCLVPSKRLNSAFWRASSATRRSPRGVIGEKRWVCRTPGGFGRGERSSSGGRHSRRQSFKSFSKALGVDQMTYQYPWRCKYLECLLQR